MSRRSSIASDPRRYGTHQVRQQLRPAALQTLSQGVVDAHSSPFGNYLQTAGYAPVGLDACSREGGLYQLRIGRVDAHGLPLTGKELLYEGGKKLCVAIITKLGQGVVR